MRIRLEKKGEYEEDFFPQKTTLSFVRMEGFFYFCGKLKTTRLSGHTYLQPDMKTATLLGDKKLENEAISLLKSCLINHQLPLVVVVGGGEDSLGQMLHSIPTANTFICSNITMGQSVRQSENTKCF